MQVNETGFISYTLFYSRASVSKINKIPSENRPFLKVSAIQFNRKGKKGILRIIIPVFCILSTLKEKKKLHLGFKLIMHFPTALWTVDLTLLLKQTYDMICRKRQPLHCKEKKKKLGCFSVKVLAFFKRNSGFSYSGISPTLKTRRCQHGEPTAIGQM